MRAWTLGYPPAYEKAIRISGNAKQPGGFAFRTREDAAHYAATHRHASTYAPYEMSLSDEFDRVTKFVGDCYVLLVEAPLINPDTGEPV